MKGLLPAVRETISRGYRWLPDTVDVRVRFIAWVSLVCQVLIVGTGGAVRLTGSGLGCPTWPRCTAESFVSTPEQGLHGVIEFGNRLLTFVLAIVAIAAFLLILRLRRERPELFRLAVVLGLGIPAQAVLGGLTVLTGLNPWLVGAHYIVSAVLVVIATIFVFRVYHGPATGLRATPAWYSGIAATTSVFVGFTVAIGVVTTGAGPHAGDADTPRNGLDPVLLQHLHSYPAYLTLALTVVLLVAAGSLGLPRVRRFVAALLAVELVQVAVGIAQARTGLPELLVGIHMVLACVLVAAITAVVLSQRLPARAPAEPLPRERLNA